LPLGFLLIVSAIETVLVPVFVIRGLSAVAKGEAVAPCVGCNADVRGSLQKIDLATDKFVKRAIPAGIPPVSDRFGSTEGSADVSYSGAREPTATS
jgi:hypothetical protein